MRGPLGRLLVKGQNRLIGNFQQNNIGGFSGGHFFIELKQSGAHQSGFMFSNNGHHKIFSSFAQATICVPSRMTIFNGRTTIIN